MSLIRDNFRSILTAACTFALVVAFAETAKPMIFFCQNGVIRDYEIVNTSSINKYEAKALIDSGDIGKIATLCPGCVYSVSEKWIKMNTCRQLYQVYMVGWTNSTQ